MGVNLLANRFTNSGTCFRNGLCHETIVCGMASKTLNVCSYESGALEWPVRSEPDKFTISRKIRRLSAQSSRTQ